MTSPEHPLLGNNAESGSSRRPTANKPGIKPGRPYGRILLGVSATLFVIVTSAFAHSLYSKYSNGDIQFAALDDHFYTDGEILTCCVDGGEMVFVIVRRFGYLVWFEDAAIQDPSSLKIIYGEGIDKPED